ncbi:MAG: NusG domain II-containing protein [Anaerococcus sp.]|nr:NusG domain II-containing protein [Anaerococcus sp.]
MKLKRGDILVILILLTFSLGLAFFISNMTSGLRGNVLRIEQDSKIIKEVSLDKDQEFRINYGGHYNIVEIKDGKAFVSEADCLDQICTHMAPIAGVGETIVCLPHRLFLEVYNVDDDNMNNDRIDKVVR